MAQTRALWTFLQQNGAFAGAQANGLLNALKAGSTSLQNASGFGNFSSKATTDINFLCAVSTDDDSKKGSVVPKLGLSSNSMLVSSLMNSKLAQSSRQRKMTMSSLMQNLRTMSSAAGAHPPAHSTPSGPRTETGVVRGFHDNPLNPAAITWWPCLFLGIIMGNLIGRLPLIGADGALTGALGVALGTSFTVWTAFTAMGLATKGTKFFKLFIPGGSPPVLAPVFSALELVSYTFRAISLGVRLWANMFSGHTLLHILTSMVLSLMFCLDGLVRLPIAILLFTLLSALVGLEWLILVLQAGVFVMLSSFYAGEVAEISADDD